jgi:exopolysaccharide biosynthesis WecB/TagA/CpsF family protein
MADELSRVLGFRFLNGATDQLLERVLQQARLPCAYVITPNVDFVVRANEDTAARALYDGAVIQICDSRVLRLVLRPLGFNLSCLPGSDMVRLLLDRAGVGMRFMVVGPTEARMAQLRARYPQNRLVLLPTPHSFARGDEMWRQCTEAAAQADWNVALICLGSPKQEAFAADLAARRAAPGVALCVGASIDFLTGAQIRAPRWMQRLALEWLFRLVSNPRRLWRRYLVENPKFLLLVTRAWVQRFSSSARE